jgi:hypothetical protein
MDLQEQSLLAAYDRIIAEARVAAAARAARGRTWPDRVYLGLEGLLSWIARQPAEASVALVEIPNGGPNARARHEETVAEVGDLLRVGREKSQTAREAPQVLEQALVEGTAYVLSTRLAETDRGSIPALCPELAWLILRPYLEVGEIERVVASHR